MLSTLMDEGRSRRHAPVAAISAREGNPRDSAGMAKGASVMVAGSTATTGAGA